MMLGEKIHRLRKEKGMSQEELASRLTVSRQAISKWELGESVPDTENVMQLSRLFGVSTDYMLNDEYESDTDIPAVKENSENMKTEYRGKAKKASYVLIGIGLVGILTMWILSSVIPSMKMVPDFMGPPTPVQEGAELSDEERQRLIDMESMTFYTSREVRGDLGAFLDTYHLTALFALCCAVVLAGTVLLLYTFNVFQKRRKNLQIKAEDSRAVL